MIIPTMEINSEIKLFFSHRPNDENREKKVTAKKNSAAVAAWKKFFD